MRKKIDQESCPVWYEDKKINEVLFCDEFLAEYPIRCINDRLFTVNGPVDNEDLIKNKS